MNECLVCRRIAQIQRGENPFFVRELRTGYVVLGDSQRFSGYTLFLCKTCAPELHLLPKAERSLFLEEMTLVAQAVHMAFKPDKLHYELLGVGEGVHMHWHLFPRRAGDTPRPGPVWQLPKEELYAPQYRPAPEELETMKCRLHEALDQLLTNE